MPTAKPHPSSISSLLRSGCMQRRFGTSQGLLHRLYGSKRVGIVIIAVAVFSFRIIVSTMGVFYRAPGGGRLHILQRARRGETARF